MKENEINQSRQEIVPGVVILPEYHNKFLLEKHYRELFDTVFLELPRGFGESNMSDKDNAIRELYEETGLVAKEILHLGRIYPDTGALFSYAEAFLIRVEYGSPCSKDKEEPILGFEWYSLEDLKALIKEGKICDGFTLSTLSFL